MADLSRREFVVTSAAAVGLVAGCVEAARRTEWPMFRAGGDNRASTREDPGDGLEVGWSLGADELFQTGGADVRLGSPVGDTETVYITGRYTLDDDPITALASIDVADGTVAWERQLVTTDPVDPDGIAQPAFVWDDYVVAVGGREATVFHREDGATAFTIALPWRPATVPGGDRALLALAGDGAVAMLDLDEDEDVRWTLDDPGGALAPINPLTVLEDSIYIPIEGGLVQLRRGDGELVWHGSLGDAATTTPPLVDGHNLHLRLHDDGGESLLALARSDRTPHWERELDGVTDPRPLLAYRAGRLYALDGGTLHSVQVGDGETDVEAVVDVEAPYPTVGGDHVYLLGADELVVVDRNDGAITQRLDLPGEPGIAPQEALPRSAALVVSRRDRVLGLQQD